jgi:hypothetical protein
MQKHGLWSNFSLFYLLYKLFVFEKLFPCFLLQKRGQETIKKQGDEKLEYRKSTFYARSHITRIKSWYSMQTQIILRDMQGRNCKNAASWCSSRLPIAAADQQEWRQTVAAIAVLRHIRQTVSLHFLFVIKRNGLQIWRVAATIPNKQSRTANKAWSSNLGVGRRANNSP